jgi:hypothetical protein
MCPDLDEFMAMALFYHVAHFLSVALPRGKAPPLPRPSLRELSAGAAALTTKSTAICDLITSMTYNTKTL